MLGSIGDGLAPLSIPYAEDMGLPRSNCVGSIPMSSALIITIEHLTVIVSRYTIYWLGIINDALG